MTFTISQTPRWTEAYAALGLLLALTGCSEPEPCKPMSVATVRLGGHVYAVPPEFNGQFANSPVDTRVDFETPEDAVVSGPRPRRIGHYCTRSPDPTPAVQTISTVDGQQQLPKRFAPLRAATYLALEEIPPGRQRIAPTGGTPWRDGLNRTEDRQMIRLFGENMGPWKHWVGAVCSKSLVPGSRDANCRVGTGSSSSGAQLTIDLTLHNDDVSSWPEIFRAADDAFESFRKN